MAKQDNIVVEGTVTEALGNSNFRVVLDMGNELLCTISGKMRKFYIKVVVLFATQSDYLHVFDLIGNIIELSIFPFCVCTLLSLFLHPAFH